MLQIIREVEVEKLSEDTVLINGKIKVKVEPLVAVMSLKLFKEKFKTTMQINIEEDIDGIERIKLVYLSLNRIYIEISEFLEDWEPIWNIIGEISDKDRA